MCLANLWKTKQPWMIGLVTALLFGTTAPAAAQGEEERQRTITQERQAATAEIRSFLNASAVRLVDVDQRATDAALATAVRRVLVERAVVDPLATSTGQAGAQHQVAIVAEQGEVSGRGRFYLPMYDNLDLI